MTVKPHYRANHAELDALDHQILQLLASGRKRTVELNDAIPSYSLRTIRYHLKNLQTLGLVTSNQSIQAEKLTYRYNQLTLEGKEMI